MPDTSSRGGVPHRPPAVSDVHILWITAGLGCDGDSVSVTAAEQPSLEDALLGAIPGLPKVHLHNPVLAYEVGDDFMKYFYEAEQGRLDPFVLVVEGSIPNEEIKSEGYWAAFGTDPKTGQPITTCEWIHRLASKALAVVAGRDLQPTVVFMPWQEIRRDAWVLPTIRAGDGDQRPACRLLMSQVAQCSRTILWRLSFIWSIRPRVSRRLFRSMISCGRLGFLARRCTRVATAVRITSKQTSLTNTVPQSAWSKWAAGGRS